jgi:hypothetical protein
MPHSTKGAVVGAQGRARIWAMAGGCRVWGTWASMRCLIGVPGEVRGRGYDTIIHSFLFYLITVFNTFFPLSVCFFVCFVLLLGFTGWCLGCIHHHITRGPLATEGTEQRGQHPRRGTHKNGRFLRGVGVVMMTGFGVLACMALVGDGVGVCVYFPRFPSGGFRLLVGVDGGGGGRVETAPAL